MSVRAAVRDASFYATHQQTIARAAEGVYVPRYHVVADNGEGPACNPDGALLVVDEGSIWTGKRDCTIAAEEVAEHMRCRRAACARRWPA